MMRALVIRSASRAAETARRLEACGIEAVELPLSRPVATRAPLPDGPFDAIIVTSRNAMAFLDPAGGDDVSRTLPVFAVGEASAASAREQGFTHVTVGEGDAAGLARTVMQAFGEGEKGRSARLLHAAGQQRAFAIEEVLGEAGLEVALWEVYRMERIDPGREAMEAALLQTAEGLHLFHSMLSAAHFMEIVSRYGLSGLCSGATALAISSRTSHSLPKGIYKDVVVAKSPNETAMISLARGLADAMGK